MEVHYVVHCPSISSLIQLPYSRLSYCRCVADEQRSLSLGIQSLLFRAFGSAPGPILFGIIIDSTCMYWQRECGRRGNCWAYDNSDLSLRALIAAIGGLVINAVFSVLAWLFYPSTLKHNPCKNNPETSGESGDPETGSDKSKENGIELLKVTKSNAGIGC